MARLQVYNDAPFQLRRDVRVLAIVEGLVRPVLDCLLLMNFDEASRPYHDRRPEHNLAVPNDRLGLFKWNLRRRRRH